MVHEVIGVHDVKQFFSLGNFHETELNLRMDLAE